MERIPEPQLMDDWAQAKAYAESDFSEPHNAYVAKFQETFPSFADRFWGTHVVDLGCGTADPAIRFARAFPRIDIHGIDGSYPMLFYGRRALINLKEVMVAKRIKLKEAMLPDHGFNSPAFHAVISNSLLHHLPDPQVLWRSVFELALPGAPIFIMDLMRPDSKEAARKLVEMHSLPTDPELMKKDFYNSLLAAFEPAEVEEQLDQSDLRDYHIHVDVISNRHLLVHGWADW